MNHVPSLPLALVFLEVPLSVRYHTHSYDIVYDVSSPYVTAHQLMHVVDVIYDSKSYIHMAHLQVHPSDPEN